VSAFTKDADWLDWDPAPSKPAFTPPPGAVDAHCHVFGPGYRFPFASTRKYTPCDDGLLVDRIPVIAKTETLQRALLVDNPVRLYW